MRKLVTLVIALFTASAAFAQSSSIDATRWMRDHPLEVGVGIVVVLGFSLVLQSWIRLLVGKSNQTGGVRGVLWVAIGFIVLGTIIVWPTLSEQKQAPTEENARAVVENIVRSSLPQNVSFRLMEFRKANGRNVTAPGVEAYQLFYRAVVEFPQGISPGQREQSVFDQLLNVGTEQGAMMALSQIGFQVTKGNKLDEYTVMESNASVSFQKTERGWLGQDGQVY